MARRGQCAPGGSTRPAVCGAYNSVSAVLVLGTLSLLGRGDNLFFKKKKRGTTKREARTTKREVEARPQFGTTNGEATSFGRPIENIFGGLRVGTTRREGGGRGDDQYTCFGQRTTKTQPHDERTTRTEYALLKIVRSCSPSKRRGPFHAGRNRTAPAGTALGGALASVGPHR